MGKVIADISVSVDGFVTGPGADPEHGLGEAGGEALHEWVTSGHEVDNRVLAESLEATGAVVMGRRLFDVVDGPHGWSDEMGYGAAEKQATAGPPVVVATRNPPATWRLGSRFSFAPDLAAAVERARELSGGTGDIVIMGGGAVVGAAVYSGLADELRLHVAPVALGAGTPLFTPGQGGPVRLEQREVRISPVATHIYYKAILEDQDSNSVPDFPRSASRGAGEQGSRGMTDAVETVVAFNECINSRDLDGLGALMAEEHTFVDSAGSRVEGRAACVEAWRGFFASFPDYRNVFDTTEAGGDGDVVTVTGRSECSVPELSGPARWRARVRAGVVEEWRVYEHREPPARVRARAAGRRG
jgi:dihydrofolate reductase/ketosteroid isomerase-like protein